MESSNRKEAYDRLTDLANKQGYVTFDEIINCADEYSLSIQDFDWFSNAITVNGILVCNEDPSCATANKTEYFDFAQGDYDEVYKKIIQLNPSLETFVNEVKNIMPPQWQEIQRLKYQVIDGNKYARSRMIEMHLRIALKIALRRAEAFNIDIDDAIGDACMGLTMAVDKYNPDKSGSFASYASLWILQNIAREQGTCRPSIYYPVHLKESFFSMYPVFKNNGCIGCADLWNCKKARLMVTEKFGCSVKDADRIIEQMIPDSNIEDLIDLYAGANGDTDSRDVLLGTILGDVAPDTVVSGEDFTRSIDRKILVENIANILKTLTPREEAILKLRFGFDGPEQTYEQIGNRFDVSRERVRQIQLKALKKLRRRTLIIQLKRYF